MPGTNFHINSTTWSKHWQDSILKQVVRRYCERTFGKKKMTMTREAKIIGEINIPIGASCAFFSNFSGLSSCKRFKDKNHTVNKSKHTGNPCKIGNRTSQLSPY